MTRTDPEFYYVGAVQTEDGLTIQDFETQTHARAQHWHDAIQEAQDTGKLISPSTRLHRPRVRIVGRSRSWPSVIGPWQCHNPVIVSHWVAQALDASDLIGYRLTEVEHKRPTPLRLFLSRRPRYFAFEPLGRMSYSLRIYERFDNRYEFRFATSGFSDPRISEIHAQHGRYLYRRIPLPDTWDRSDFFLLGDHMFGGFCCTRAFLDLVRAADFDGFTFHPLDALGESWVDVRSRSWPPSTWYPDKQPD